MAATKEQERKALEKIKKIVTDLGEDSYISMAFEGCFEIAEGNIENDFGCSMKQRAESSAAEAAKYKEMYESAVKDYEAEKRTVEELEQKVLTLEEAGAIKAILIDSKTEAIRRTEESARKIVEFADNPDSAEFKQAVQDNRHNKQLVEEVGCQAWGYIEYKKPLGHFDVINYELAAVKIKTLHLKYIGRDDWGRYVYEDENGKLWKNTDCCSPRECCEERGDTLNSSAGNEFDGEPDCFMAAHIKVEYLPEEGGEQDG